MKTITNLTFDETLDISGGSPIWWEKIKGPLEDWLFENYQ